MASPTPYYTSNNNSLLVSPSPPQPRLSPHWERLSAPPRDPSRTLPPPIPSQPNRQTIQQQPDPTLYQNHYFSPQDSGSASGSRPRQHQQAGLLQTQHVQPYAEPQLPPPTPLTPSRFELSEGENYLSSTPDGGWNFDFSDGLDLEGTGQNDFDYNWDLPGYQQLEQQQPLHRLQQEADAIDLTNTSPAMARVTSTSNGRKRSAATATATAPRNSEEGDAETLPPPAKRTKTSPSDPYKHDLFGSEGNKEDIDEVDLVGVDNDEDYEAKMKKRKEDEMKRQRQEESEKPVKLASQQCVICLDQPEGLTVTHCGHMFCAECLHGALNTNMMGKKVCPVCRSNINTNKNNKGMMPKTGVYYMEMKLQTRKQGKMPKKG